MYCNNYSMDHLDYEGTKVKCVFSITNHEFAMIDEDTNRTYLTGAKSGDSNISHQWQQLGPLPMGEWYIIFHAESYRFSLWYADDGYLDDIAENNKKKRTNIRLVINSISHGCISLYETATSEAVMEAIESTQWSYVRAGDGKFYRCYGCVNVAE